MVMRRSKKRSRSAYGQDSCDACIRELRQTLKKLRGVADITCALAIQMARLRKLREAVQKAEEATARTAKQRHHEKHSLATQQIKLFSRSGGSGLRCNFTRARSTHSRRQGNKSFPWDVIFQSRWCSMRRRRKTPLTGSNSTGSPAICWRYQI
jgi:hypothetical protein